VNRSSPDATAQPPRFCRFIRSESAFLRWIIAYFSCSFLPSQCAFWLFFLKAFFCFLTIFSDEEEHVPADEQASQPSTQRRHVVRKVPISRVAQEEQNSSDDFVKPKSSEMRIKKAGVKPPKQAPCSRRTKDAEHPIQDDKVYVGFFDKLFLCLVIRGNIFLGGMLH
jgi:hypothetical protein